MVWFVWLPESPKFSEVLDSSSVWAVGFFWRRRYGILQRGRGGPRGRSIIFLMVVSFIHTGKHTWYHHCLQDDSCSWSNLPLWILELVIWWKKSPVALWFSILPQGTGTTHFPHQHQKIHIPNHWVESTFKADTDWTSGVVGTLKVEEVFLCWEWFPSHDFFHEVI